MLAILAGLKPFEERFRDDRQAVQFHLEVRPGAMSIALLQDVLGWRAARVRQLVVRSRDGAGADEVTLTIGRQPSRDTDEMLRLLESCPAVPAERAEPTGRRREVAVRRAR